MGVNMKCENWHSDPPVGLNLYTVMSSAYIVAGPLLIYTRNQSLRKNKDISLGEPSGFFVSVLVTLQNKLQDFSAHGKVKATCGESEPRIIY